MPRPTPLPAATPRTTTQLLLARGGDPHAQAHTIVASAQQSVTELLGFLPQDQQSLRSRFTQLQQLLTRAAQALPVPVSGPNQVAPQLMNALGWGEPIVMGGAPLGQTPVNPDPEAEPVYGMVAALNGAHRYLEQAVRAAEMGAHTWGAQRLVQAGAVSHAATAVDYLAAMFTAAAWEFERPLMPSLASKSGRIELRASPRATPQTTWARYARAMFLSDRVELTTASGRHVIGDTTPIAFLLHVLPPSPTAAVTSYDPTEAYGQVPLYDELGIVHFCDADGRSLGAIAVADWLVQPEMVVAQAAVVQPSVRIRAYDRLIWALDVVGITAGAATLRVPIRRGVQHPPPRDPSTLQTNRVDGKPLLLTPGAQPAPIAARVLRPGPHKVPYSGQAATPSRAFLRRTRRHNSRQLDLGPSSPITETARVIFPTMFWCGAIFSGYLLSGNWLVRLCMVIALITVAEPWITWAVRWFGDRDMRRMVAVYKPGAAAGRSRAFQYRARLMFDGANIGVRTGTGHEAWVAAATDGDLGVVALRRLIDNGTTWGFALTDRSGRWRMVLPADAWAPGGDLTGLAGFAGAADLTLSDEQAPAPPISDDVMIENSPTTLSRSHGPLTRGMVIIAIHAIIAFVITLPGSTLSSYFTLGVAAIALVPVFLRWMWTAWLTRPVGSATTGA